MASCDVIFYVCYRCKDYNASGAKNTHSDVIFAFFFEADKCSPNNALSGVQIRSDRWIHWANTNGENKG